jgi:hypothetical protein
VNISLPEEHLRLGKAQSFGVEPVSVSPESDPLAEVREQAMRVEQRGERFSTRERDEALARIIRRIRL